MNRAPCLAKQEGSPHFGKPVCATCAARSEFHEPDSTCDYDPLFAVPAVSLAESLEELDEHPAARVVDLMDALKTSLGVAK